MRWWIWLLVIVVPLILGFLSSLWGSTKDNEWYEALNKPSWQPPGWVFSVVWAILYVAFGIAFGFVLDSFLATTPDSNTRILAIGLLFGLGLFFLLLLIWPGVFFNAESIVGGLVVLVLTLILALILVGLLFSSNFPISGSLMVLFVIWLSIALSLNVNMFKHNPT